MGFKIASLEQLKTTASKLDQYSVEAEAESKKVIEAVEGLSSSISGMGVSESLQTLNNSINNNTTQAVNALKYVSSFITSQVGSYAQTEDDANSTLSNVQSILDGMQSI